MLYRLCILAFAASASAFSVVAPLRGGATRASMPKMADIGDTGVSFETVAREWRCKFFCEWTACFALLLLQTLTCSSHCIR